MPARGALPLNEATALLPRRSVLPAALACVAGLAVLLICGAIETQRGLWQDEATLLANFGLPWTAYFHALPFYDQAGPPLALLLLDGVYLIAGGEPQTMRWLLLGLNAGVLGLLALLAWRRGDREVLLAIAVTAVTPLAIRYTVEIKQYVFELHASLLFLAALRWNPRRPALVFALAGLLSFVSYSIMLVVGIASLDAIVFRLRGPLRWRWLVMLAFYTVVWLACYLLLFRPATAFQMANYPAAYERFPLAAYVRHPGLLYSQVMAVTRAQAVLPAAAAVLAILALALPRRGAAPPRRAVDIGQPARVFVGLIGLVAVLWLAGLYPVSSNKQFLFTLPIGALLIAHLVIASGDRLDRTAATALLIAATILPSAAGAIQLERRGGGNFQDTRGLYQFIQTHRERLIVPTVLFEPTLRNTLARDRDPPRHLAGLLARDTRPMKPTPQLLADLGTDDVPIFQHIWLPLDVTGRHDLYADWLARRACGHRPALVAAAQVSADFGPMLAAAAKRHGCSVSLAYRSTGVAAYSVSRVAGSRRANSTSSATSGSAQITRVP